jgi:diguanylate cyclase
MSPNESDILHLKSIQGDFLRIENDWLILHYRISLLLVAFALVFECLLSAVVVSADMLSTTIERYIFKFIVIPSGANLLCIAADAAAVHSRRISRTAKIYTVSLIFTLICFNLYTAHSAFVSMYYLFAVGMLLTTIYASYTLTGIVTTASIVSLTFSELLIHWDTDKISLFDSSQRMLNFLIALVILLGCGIVSCVIISYAKRKNTVWIQKECERKLLKWRLRYDELTGAFSRSALYDDLRDLENDTAERSHVFIIADIDHFKEVNDRFGHHAGDLCLSGFARVLRGRFRDAGVYRYGGDEFCILVSALSPQDAVSHCEGAQTDLSNLRFEEYPELQPRACFGIAAYLPGSDDAVQLFLRADKALYEAKRTRNSVRVYPQEQPAC